MKIKFLTITPRKKLHLINILISTFLIFSLIGISYCIPLKVNANSLTSENVIFGEAIYDDGMEATGSRVEIVSNLGMLTTWVSSGGKWKVNFGDPGPNWPQGTDFTVWITGCCGHSGWSGNTTGTINGSQNDMGLIIIHPNSPPNKPSIPKGRLFLKVNEIGIFETNATDPNALNNVQYRFDWDSLGSHNMSVYTFYVKSGENANKSHYWNLPGTYIVKAQAKDEYGANSEWSDGLQVIVYTNNYPPEKPIMLGPNEGLKDKNYYFNISTIDLDNHEIEYYIDWGDNTKTGWIGPYNSGESITLEHNWTKRGTYQITAKAKDIYDVESVISDPINIQILAPEIKITKIYGSFLRLKADIQNVGEDTATDIHWNIKLEGGLLISGDNTTGQISTINPEDKVTINTGLIFGFSVKTTVTVNAKMIDGDENTKQEEIIIFLFNIIF